MLPKNINCHKKDQKEFSKLVNVPSSGSGLLMDGWLGSWLVASLGGLKTFLVN